MDELVIHGPDSPCPYEGSKKYSKAPSIFRKTKYQSQYIKYILVICKIVLGRDAFSVWMFLRIQMGLCQCIV